MQNQIKQFLPDFSRFTEEEKAQFSKDYITARRLPGCIYFYKADHGTVRNFSDWLKDEFAIKDATTATDKQLLNFFNYLPKIEQWQINSKGNYYLEISALDSKTGKTEHIYIYNKRI